MRNDQVSLFRQSEPGRKFDCDQHQRLLTTPTRWIEITRVMLLWGLVVFALAVWRLKFVEG